MEEHLKVCFYRQVQCEYCEQECSFTQLKVKLNGLIENHMMQEFNRGRPLILENIVVRLIIKGIMSYVLFDIFSTFFYGPEKNLQFF